MLNPLSKLGTDCFKNLIFLKKMSINQYMETVSSNTTEL